MFYSFEISFHSPAKIGQDPRWRPRRTLTTNRREKGRASEKEVSEGRKVYTTTCRSQMEGTQERKRAVAACCTNVSYATPMEWREVLLCLKWGARMRRDAAKSKGNQRRRDSNRRSALNLARCIARRSRASAAASPRCRRPLHKPHHPNDAALDGCTYITYVVVYYLA